MNRYRTLPGLGQPKASSTTTCQKCLKRDNYECKSTTQERPYISRPSRTQQLLNPKLKPKLVSDQGNALMKSQGVADQELARAQAARDVTATLRRSRSPESDHMTNKRARSASLSSLDSVSTISTSRSRSRSRSPPPKPALSSRAVHSDRARQSRSRSTSRPRKRKYRDSSVSRSPLRVELSNKSRRYRSDSPDDRGRPAENRRGSNHSRSRDLSSNRSEITKQRRSLEDAHDSNGRNMRGFHIDGRAPEQQENRTARPPRPPRKERSLSPYSRRLALTQAMNMGR